MIEYSWCHRRRHHQCQWWLRVPFILLVMASLPPLASCSDKFLSYLGINERLAITNLSEILQNQAAYMIPSTTTTTAPPALYYENPNFLGLNQSGSGSVAGFFNKSYVLNSADSSDYVNTNNRNLDQAAAGAGASAAVANANANTTTVVVVGETLTFSPGLTVVIAIIASMMSSITIIGNVLVITAFIIDKNLRKYSNYFILNLSIADLLIGLLIPPYAPFLLYNRHWRMGRVACTIWLVLDYVVGSASVLCIVVISLDRYLLVSRGLKYVADQKVSKAIFIMVTVWLIAFFNYAPAIIFWEFISGKRTVQDGDCQVEFHDNLPYLTATACVEFFAPFISITALNLAVYLNIRKRSRGLIRSQKPHFTLPKEVTAAPTTTNPSSAPPALPTIETNGKLHHKIKSSAAETERKAMSLTSNDLFLSDKNVKKIFELANSTYGGASEEAVEVEADVQEDPKSAARKRTTFSTKLTFKEPTSNSRETTEADSRVSNKKLASRTHSKSKFTINPAAILKKKMATLPNSYSSNSSSISIASSFGVGGGYDENKKHSAQSSDLNGGKLLLMRFETDHDFENEEDDNDNEQIIYAGDDCDGDSSRVDQDELIKLNEIIAHRSGAGAGNRHLSSEQQAAVVKHSSKSLSTRTKYKTTKFDQTSQNQSGLRAEAPYGRSLSQPEAAPQAKEAFEKELIVKSNGKKSHSSQQTHTSSFAVLSKGGSIALSNTSIPMSKKHSSATLTKDKKAARSLFILVFVFVFCWAPYTFLTLIKSVCPSCVNDNVYEFAFWLLWFNSTFNPILYPFLHVKFRKAFYKILTCVLFCCFSKNRSRDYNSTLANQSVAITNRTRVLSEKPSYDS